MNFAIISGYLVENPQITQAGEHRVINGTIVHNHHFTDKQGNKRQEATFLDFQMWNQLADTVCAHVTTKRKIEITGRIKQERWEKDGGKHSRMVLVVDAFQFMDSPVRSERLESAPG